MRQPADFLMRGFIKSWRTVKIHLVPATWTHLFSSRQRRQQVGQQDDKLICAKSLQVFILDKKKSLHTMFLFVHLFGNTQKKQIHGKQASLPFVAPVFCV